MNQTPYQLGYRMCAEWEPHEATWLAWPQNEETWPGKLSEVEEIYLQMMEALLPQEKVCLLVKEEATRDRVTERLRKRGVGTQHLAFYMIPTVDAWIRDYGPNFILRVSGGRRETAYVHWRFNAWGGKYELHAKDEQVPKALEPILGMPVFRPGLVLEGGSIDTNGRGTCLATEQCLLNPNRNPGRSREEIEETLHNFLGMTHFVWLGEGIEGDDTDGHIDDLSRFVGPETVVTAVEEDGSDRNAPVLRKNLKRLQKAVDQGGRRLTVVPLPMPGRMEGPRRRLPASYLNFYMANGVVLVPIFGHKNDEVALKTLMEIFPKRKVIGIRSGALVLGMGGVHCVTHEEP